MMHRDGTAPSVSIPGVDLGEMVGAGAFGSVHRGHHRFLDIDVAVKLIDVARVEPTGSRKLLQEAQLMARLDHPNLVRVFDAGPLDRHIYLVLEFMDGGSCARLQRVPAKTAGEITMQLLSGLQALHEARVVHRDIKPANCLRRGNDRVKLADLGLAIELTSETERTLDTAGTVPFMAPELFENPPRYGPPSDLYALGMTLACFMLDAPPYPRGSLSEMLPWILQGPRPSIVDRRPDIPLPLGALVGRMVSPRAAERPQTAGEALADLAVIAPSSLSKAPSFHGPAVGPWIVGASVYASSNWEGWAVTHSRTGAAARLMRMKADAPLRPATAMVLKAAERSAKLEDSCVVPVLDWGLWDDQVYVVTAPWGHTLFDLVRARGPFDEVSALRLARDVAEAIASIHRRGLVYQNLDPGSAVMASDARSAQLSWPIYCVAAGSSAEQRILVPRFAAPEALFNSARTIDPPVDVFGVGAVLLFLLTGEGPPRNTPSMSQFVRAEAPEITAATGSLVGELLDFAPEERPTAEVALGRIRQLLTRLERAASPTG